MMRTLCRAESLDEAFLLQSQLRAEGISATVPDEFHAQLLWVHHQTLGWIRVQVPTHQLEEAREILGLARRDRVENGPLCPECGSKEVDWTNPSRRLAAGLFLLIHLPIPFDKRARLSCGECRHHWIWEEADLFG